MKTYFNIYIALLLWGLVSCQKEPSLPKTPLIDLGGEIWHKGTIDEIIYQEFVKSYNIEIKYKWSPFEINYNRTLVPPDEARLKPVFKAI